MAQLLLLQARFFSSGIPELVTNRQRVRTCSLPSTYPTSATVREGIITECNCQGIRTRLYTWRDLDVRARIIEPASEWIVTDHNGL